MSRKSFRKILTSLLESPTASSVSARPDLSQRGPLRLETLERRQLLAGDVELLFTGAEGLPVEDFSAHSSASSDSAALPIVQQGEGEAAPDLVQFAKNLASAGVEFFGAHWCPACTQQKQIFDDGGDDLPFIEVTNPDRTPNSIGIAEGIDQYPTWRFPDDSEAVGVLSLETISSRSGVPIPQNETPTFDALGPQNVRIGSPLHLVIDAYDPDGNVLTTTVTVEDPSLIEATVITGNRSLRLDMEGFDDMVFELFEQRAPVPAGRVADLAESGFYDGIIFHRVVNGFVIQAGDPTGTGTSGSALGVFDDQFHPDLQHNRDGILSFAKTSDDTNNSQFFVTERDTRHLDFNHSIFGQLVEGEDVREAISNMQTNPPASQGGGAPTTPIRIDNATVFTDTENSVVMLKALGGTGTTNVTITVTDPDGNTHSEVVPVTVIADTGQSTNSQPFLNAITSPITAAVDTPATLQLSSVDVEGDPVVYGTTVLTTQSGGPVATASVDSSGLVTVTPTTGFTGTVDVRVQVAAQTSASGDDRQVVQFNFVDGQLTPPTGLELSAASDSGSSNTDNVTNAGSLTFNVTGVESGDTVEIINTDGGAVIGTAVATGTSLELTTNNIAALGDGDYVLAARRSNGASSSTNSSTLTVTYDSTPPAPVGDTAATQANVGRAFITNLISTEEGSGLVYALADAPTGATIDATTGLVNWTPTAADVGTVDVEFQMTDSAGNVRNDSFSINVENPPLAGIRLEVTDLSGNVINNVSTGQEFELRMYGVDERPGFDRRGIFAAFADILFDSGVIRPVPGSTIEYSDDFLTVQNGSFQDGLIDELGAAQTRLVPSDEAESLIATVRMEAIASGSTNIVSERADLSSSETLLYSTDNRIPAENVVFGTVSLTVDQNFSVVGDTFTVAEDTTGNLLDVLDNDTAATGTTLTLVSVEQPTSGGTVSISNGQLSFTPTPDFVGDVSFTYRVANSDGIQDDGTVNVTVTNVNDPPLGASDSFTVDQGTVLNVLDLLANDSSAPDTGEELTITGVTASTAGATIEIAADGKSVEYTPPATFTGSDSFTYTLSDGTDSVAVGVSVTVNPGDEPPTAVDDAFTVTEDASRAGFDVLANDTRDVDNQTFSITSVETPSAGGTVTISTDGGELLYTPAANFAGTETVRYTIQDTGGGLAVGTVTFTVTNVNDPPAANDETTRVVRSAGETAVLTLQDLPENVDAGEVLRFSAVGTTSQGGTVRINTAEDTIFYTAPAGEFVGDDIFTYTVTDPEGLQVTATMTVTVTDFEPRDILLSIDNNLSGDISGIRLVGTNELGEDVDVSASRISDGRYGFLQQLPGNFRVVIPAIPFLQNGAEPQELNITSAPEDGDANIQADLGGLRPEYISIRDWLGNAPRQSILAVVQPGQSPVFMTTGSDTGSVTDPTVELNSSGDEVTIRGLNGSSANVEAAAPVRTGRQVDVRGTVGDMRLMKISLDSRHTTFVESSTSTTTASSDPPVTQAVQSATTQVTGDSAAGNVLLPGDDDGEGESPISGGVSLIDVVTPTATPVTSSATSRFGRFASSAGNADDGIGQRNARPTEPVAETVDATMPDVSPRLSLQSSAADRVATTMDDAGLNSDAVDEAITSSLV